MNKECKAKIRNQKNRIKELEKQITSHKKVIKGTVNQCKKNKYYKPKI